MEPFAEGEGDISKAIEHGRPMDGDHHVEQGFDGHWTVSFRLCDRRFRSTLGKGRGELPFLVSGRKGRQGRKADGGQSLS